MFPESQQPTVTRAQSIDAGLQKHMQSIYNRMTLGVLVTAITAAVVAGSPDLMKLFLGGPQKYVVMFAPIAIVWFGFNPMTMKQSTLQLAFFAVSILYGISFSVLGYAYTGASIAKAFFLATGMFAGLSIFGYVTKKNLDGVGNFDDLQLAATGRAFAEPAPAAEQRKVGLDARHPRDQRLGA